MSDSGNKSKNNKVCANFKGPTSKDDAKTMAGKLVPDFVPE
jgi:hypothetical protein